jgi:hypothetical protein
MKHVKPDAIKLKFQPFSSSDFPETRAGTGLRCFSGIFTLQNVVTKYIEFYFDWMYRLPMPSRTGPAHVVTTFHTCKGKVYRTHLLRRSYREGSSCACSPTISQSR